MRHTIRLFLRLGLLALTLLALLISLLLPVIALEAEVAPDLVGLILACEPRLLLLAVLLVVVAAVDAVRRRRVRVVGYTGSLRDGGMEKLSGRQRLTRGERSDRRAHLGNVLAAV